jgi:hypothetical protein
MMQFDGSSLPLAGPEDAADATARSGSCGAPDVPFRGLGTFASTLLVEW